MNGGPSEAETCRTEILPLLAAAGWQPEQILEQYRLQNPESEHARRVARGNLRIADFVLAVDGVPVAVLEAKKSHALAADGVGQAIDYAVRLDVPFAFASNGREHLLHDRISGTENAIRSFPSPTEAWDAFTQGHALSERAAATIRVGDNRSLRAHGGSVVKELRHYQRVAVQRAIAAIGRGDRRVLLLMATGTGKTFTALQLVHKLREASKQLDGGRSYRVLYLADRDFLVSSPMSDFTEAFGQEAVVRLSKHSITRSRAFYFATYQGVDGDAAVDDLDASGDPSPVFRALRPDFFDLVVVDECHRGSAAESSKWRAVLEHFSGAVQVGLTATPKRDTNIDTYNYFGEPVFEYSLGQGIEDGYLAPYRVRRVVLDLDAFGWEADSNSRDVDGRPVPEGTYTTKDFERRLSVPDRTEAMARYLVNLLHERPTSRAVVFCVNARHAYEMKQALLNADPHATQEDPEWAVRIVGTERDRVRFLELLQDATRTNPRVATTARLLSTGVDIEDLDLVVLCRPVGSMVEFKQIVGRGTRLYPPKNKQYFEVVDFVGASRQFTDPTFDGPLPAPRVETVRPDGSVEIEETGEDPVGPSSDTTDLLTVEEPEPSFHLIAGGTFDPVNHHGGDELSEHVLPSQILTIRGLTVALLGERLQIIDAATGRLTTTTYRSYVGERVLELVPSADDFRQAWTNPSQRVDLLRQLDYLNVDLEMLARDLNLEDSDPFDVLASAAWDLEPRTRRERSAGVRERHAGEIDRLGRLAREVIDVLLERYAEGGVTEISTAALEVPPLAERGTRLELASGFGGPEALVSWLGSLQEWLYEDSRAA